MEEPLVMHNGRRLHMPEARLFEKAGLFSGAFLECDALVMSAMMSAMSAMSTMATVVTSAEANTKPAATTAAVTGVADG